MKRLAFVLCLAMTVFACSREYTEAPVTGEMHSITVNAAIPPATKLDADRGKITWSEGDAIAVYNTSGTKYELTLSDGAGTDFGKFSGSISGTLDTKAAVYPACFAGINPSTVTIPQYVERTDNVPAVMASALEQDGGQINALSFHHVMAMMEFTLTDLPAYAGAFMLKSESGIQLSGDFVINDALNGVSGKDDGGDTRAVYFPYKTAYGEDGSVVLYVPLPAFDYIDLTVRLLDGDGETIEGSTLMIPETSANLKVGDYMAMPALKVRPLIDDSRADYVKVHGTKWAKGNLVRDASVSRANWVPGWGIHSGQWETVEGNDTQTRYDHFNWGGISAASYQTDSVSVYPNKGTASGTPVAYFTYIWPRGRQVDIQGRLFRYWDGTEERSFDYTLLDGTGKGAPYFFYSGNNDGTTHPKTWESGGTPASVKTFCSYYGDIVFWASKGQFMMPGASDFEALMNSANQQAGYYENAGNRTYGILFTTCGEWQGSRTIDLTFRKLDEGDMESGLFLPLSGYRKPIKERAVEEKANLSTWSPSSSEITGSGSVGAYWSSAIAEAGVQSRRPQMFYVQADGTSAGTPRFGDTMSSESVTISSSRTCNVFSTPAGLSLRPVYLNTTLSESPAEPPVINASGNGFPALWEINSAFYGSTTAPTAAGKQWIENGRAIATNGSSTTGTAYIVTSRTKSSASLSHTLTSNGCPAVGGLDEGDCIEFWSPAENIPAGTDFDLMLTVNANSKAVPKYWVLEYWEDGEWKTGDTPYTAAEDPSIKYSCTVLRPASSCYRTLVLSFTLQKAVTNDFVKARLRAVGRINGSGTALTPSASALFYFAPLTYEAVKFIAHTDAPAVKDKKKLLVLGNSYTYYYGSAFLLKEIARQEGHQLDIRINLKGSQHFYTHLSTLEYSQEAISEGGYDFAMLQDGSYFAAEYGYGDASIISGGAAYTTAQILQYTKDMTTAVHNASPSVQVMYEVCMAAPTKNGDFQGFGSYSNFESYQLQGARSLAAEDNGINWLNPVCAAFSNARNNYGFTSAYNYLLYTDNFHPNKEGQYLKACCTYLLMYGQDFGSSPADCGLAPADAAKLRNAAKDIALTDRDSYKIR